MKSLLTITIAIALLAGCKSVDITKEEFAADGKTVTRRTTAKVNVIIMSTELEYVNILGLGSLRNYKSDGGAETIKAAAEGAANGAVKALKGGAL